MQSNPGYPTGAGRAGRGAPVLLPSQPPPTGPQPPIPCIAVFDLNSSAERPDELARPFMHEFFSAICEWAELQEREECMLRAWVCMLSSWVGTAAVHSGATLARFKVHSDCL